MACKNASLQRLWTKCSDYLEKLVISDGTEAEDVIQSLTVRGISEQHLSRVQAWNVIELYAWERIRRGRTEGLESRFLKEVLQYTEAAPLTCVLDDFLRDLDHVLVSHETRSGSPTSSDAAMTTTTTAGSSPPPPPPADTPPPPPTHPAPATRPPPSTGSDQDYIQLLEVYCLLRVRLLDLQLRWRVVRESLPTRFPGFAEQCYCHAVASLSSLVDHCRVLLGSYEAPGEGRCPCRYLLFCRKLELTDKEKEALHFIFVSNTGILFPSLYSRFQSPVPNSSGVGGSRTTSMALAAATFAQMTPKEMLHFFGQERLHMKQELFEADDEFSSVTTTTFIRIPSTVLKACCGCLLTAEELYKVDKTVVADVLALERTEVEVKQAVPSEGKGVEQEGEEQEEEEQEEEDSEEVSQFEEQGTTAEEKGDTQTVLCESLLDSLGIAKGDMSDISKSVQDDTKPSPYQTDLEYLQDNFELIESLIKARKTELNDDVMFIRPDQRKPEAVIRELKARARGLRTKIEKRLETTRQVGAWLPRLERLSELRQLETFEKNVLLVLTGTMVSRNLRNPGSQGDTLFGRHLSIGTAIGLFCDTLQEEIHSRTYFYKNSKLVSEGLVHINDPPLHNRGNFLDCVVELDRRLLDYIVGLDTEMNELVDGSDLYTPEVTLSQVSLPPEHTNILLNTFESFDLFQKTCKDLRLSTKGTAQGICLLFYGPSGTGKTMTANAVANFLKKKVLLVTVSMLEKDLSKELLKFLFREARIHNAILFFDECESLFESRESRPNPNLGVLLTEIEHYDGVIVLATNRHHDLDEAMHRRIQLALPFSVPDYTLRVDIWRSHVPATVVSPNVSWSNLAVSFELTGGLIKNAVLSALALAIKGCHGNTLVITEEHLMEGARLQLKGLLEMVDFERRIIPTFGLRDLVYDQPTMDTLTHFLSAAKARKFVTAQWGFSSEENVAQSHGIILLVCGPPGSGKTAIAHAMGYELGQPIKEVNCTELLAHTVTANPRNTRGVAAFFKDAQRANAMVVLDGAETILGAFGASSLMSTVVGCESFTLAYQIEHYSGIVILTSRQPMGQLEVSRLPRLRYVLDLRAPQVQLRAKLWAKLIPKRAPISSAVDFTKLAERFEFTGGQIANSICYASEWASNRAHPKAVITNDDLIAAAEEEWKRMQQGISPASDMFQ